MILNYTLKCTLLSTDMPRNQKSLNDHISHYWAPRGLLYHLASHLFPPLYIQRASRYASRLDQRVQNSHSQLAPLCAFEACWAHSTRRQAQKPAHQGVRKVDEGTEEGKAEGLDQRDGWDVSGSQGKKERSTGVLLRASEGRKVGEEQSISQLREDMKAGCL